tara:strand:+ start:3666 stop:3959 length:294 start_codon:yes stop_codon:yes gene_type:complete
MPKKLYVTRSQYISEMQKNILLLGHKSDIQKYAITRRKGFRQLKKMAKSNKENLLMTPKQQKARVKFLDKSIKSTYKVRRVPPRRKGGKPMYVYAGD